MIIVTPPYKETVEPRVLSDILKVIQPFSSTGVHFDHYMLPLNSMNSPLVTRGFRSSNPSSVFMDPELNSPFRPTWTGWGHSFYRVESSGS